MSSTFGDEGILLRLWGKLEKNTFNTTAYHPAIFHMLDVGYVAQALLEEDVSTRWSNVLGRAMGVESRTLSSWLPWAVALHDIGKISVVFQEQNDSQRERLTAEGFPLGERRWNNNPHHSLVSQACLGWELGELVFPKRFIRMWRDSAGGHHGRFSSNTELLEARKRLHQEVSEWKTWRLAASEMLKSQLMPFPPETWREPKNISSATMALTGFMILCDWLGSDNTFFPACPDEKLDTYAVRSYKQARQTVEAGGFKLETRSNVQAEFRALFHMRMPARPLQKAIDLIPEEILSGAVLAVIEAPTGEGKTEAALALAHKIAKQRGSDEFFYALPTTATSNQMFGRLQNFLINGLKLPTRVGLIHGQAFLYQDDLELVPLSNGERVDEKASLEWFGPKKRALLAPFGVGTIDQAELAALNVKHNALRMIGLAGKVLILDEVHAYDVYMTTVIERLLAWLGAMGTSVILLSATLPKKRRLRLARAFGGEDIEQIDNQDDYPAVCVVGEKGSYQTTPRAFQEDRTLQLGHIHFGEEEAAEKADWLLSKVKDGGCACWITNTVQRAQDIYREIKGKAEDGTAVTLIHSRYPVEERQKLEEYITKLYGPSGVKRPHSGIVIGTQVLEQSLDLDFDVMATDLAPIDLILQRGGRLQRHKRTRLPAHSAPYLWVNYIMEGGSLKPGVDAVIYDEYILRMTQSTLDGQTSIKLPGDYRRLVEEVYSAEEPAKGNALYEAWNKLRKQETSAIGRANTRLMPEPDAEDSFCGPAAQMEFEESETKAGWTIAQTRLGEESINVIPLETDGVSVWFSSQEEVYRSALDGIPSREMQLRLLRRSMRVSKREVVEALKQAALPKLFTESYLLKEYVPLFLYEGKALIEYKGSKILMELDPELGLSIRLQKGR